jgi:hypothetical protein
MIGFATPALVALGLLLQQLPDGALPREPEPSPPVAPFAPIAAPPQWQPVAPVQLSFSPPAAPVPLPRTGIFRVGLGIDLLQIGMLQVIASGGPSQGVVIGTGVEIDLGTRTALRVPIEIAYAGSSNSDATYGEQSTVFLFVGLSPGIVYRFRTERHQRWTPYVGGGARLGGFLFGRALLGLEPNPPPATTQEFSRLGVAPELAAGVLFAPARWFSLRLAIDYTYIFVAHTSVQALSETIAPRFSF